MIEDDLAARIAPHLSAGMTVAVACPETEVAKGLIFRCRVTASDHSTTDFEITLLDVAGSYSWRHLE